MLQFGLKYWLEHGGLCQQFFLDFVNSFGVDLPSVAEIKAEETGVGEVRPDLSVYGEPGWPKGHY